MSKTIETADPKSRPGVSTLHNHLTHLQAFETDLPYLADSTAVPTEWVHEITVHIEALIETIYAALDASTL